MKSKSKTLAMATAVGAAAAPASAAIIHTDLPEPISASGTSVVHFSLSEQWAANTNESEGGERFTLSFEGGGFPHPPTSEKPRIAGHSSGMVVRDETGFAKKYFEGIFDFGSETFSSFTTRINQGGNNDANWSAGTRGFVGLKFDNDGTDNYGWADIEYASDMSLILYGFAYDSAPIPEPRTTALLAALAAGSVALLARRRRAARADA